MKKIITLINGVSWKKNDDKKEQLKTFFHINSHLLEKIVFSKLIPSLNL